MGATMNENMREVSPRKELKERIILEALEAFRRDGIKAITMDDIAYLLKISKRTLYEIFADKEALLRDCVLYHQDYSREALKKVVAESNNVLEVVLKCYQGSVEAYHSMNMRFFEDIKKYPSVYAMIKDNREADNTVVINFMMQGVKEGLFRADINFDILQIMVREQIKLLMNTDITKKYSFLELYESIIFIYLRGISTAEGIKKLDEFIEEYHKK